MKGVMGTKLGDGGGGGSGEEEFPGAEMVRCVDSSRLPWTPVCMHAKLVHPAPAASAGLPRSILRALSTVQACDGSHKLCCAKKLLGA